MDELLGLEQQGWQALSSPGDAGKRFYASVLRHDAVMLFPGGMRIVGRDRILDSLGSQPWESFRIEDARTVALLADAATLTYKVTAQRQGQAGYVALIASTYVRDDGQWKLVVHQQTAA
jgi:hypothetical protein